MKVEVKALLAELRDRNFEGRKVWPCVCALLSTIFCRRLKRMRSVCLLGALSQRRETLRDE